MMLFIDTANPDEIRKYAELGIIDGVTTNPSLASKINRPYREVVEEIFTIIDGPVSLEVLGTNYEDIMREARGLVTINPQVVVKIPMIPDGIKAVKNLTKEGIKTNVTLVFSSSQAFLAAKVGATYISPFIGRVDDISYDGLALLSEIREILDNSNFTTKLLGASDRTPLHVARALMIGADVVTVKPETIEKMLKHPLTDIGLNQFLEDFKKSGLEPLV